MTQPRRSDRHWEAQRARRNRIRLLVGAVLVLLGGSGWFVHAAYWDSCTNSRQSREPRAVVDSFVAAVGRGDRTTTANCWRNEPYTDLLFEGCGERCLNGFYRVPFTISTVDLQEPQESDDGRLQQIAVVTGVCDATGAAHSGEIVLDTTPREFPWRHWKVVQSSYGGSIRDNWCEE